MSPINQTIVATLSIAFLASSSLLRAGYPDASNDFLAPPDSAKPGVYWFFMDGNLTKSGMKADLEAMKKAGLGRAIVMEADLGGPKGDVRYMTPEWLDHWRFASNEAKALGIELTSSVGPGWCGAGGPWISPEKSMQHLRASFAKFEGGKEIDATLSVPEPRDPYFGRGSLGPCEEAWRTFYRDVAVLAYPAPKEDRKLPDWEEKALFFRPPYSSVPGVKPYLPTCADDPSVVEALSNSIVPFDSIVDVTDRMDASGRFRWNAPEGDWIVVRLGRRITGQTTRPAPEAALGLESDKFESTGIDEHFANFNSKLYSSTNFTTLHHDSWEMSSQNWSEHFRDLFRAKRGYDPLPWTPAMFGVPVGSVEKTERFLWDLRRTAQELVYENNVERMKKLGAEYGLNFSTEAYDLNPAGDLYLFRAADVPMCEFWAKGYGFETTFSVIEAVSSARTTGRSIVGAESFTTADDRWRQHPGLMKRQLDWALCAGVNRLMFHRMCAQPGDDAPGFSLGPHGTHFDRTQTWFPLVGDFCEFVARAQAVLQRGISSGDVLYLDREGAPQVFVAPSSAFLPGEFKDRREYCFDACCPQVLIDSAKGENGKIVFPGGATYSLLVLPRSSEITVELAKKLRELKEAGVPIIGEPPKRTPTLVDFPNADEEVRKIVAEIWSGENAPSAPGDVERASRLDRRAIKSAKWIWASSDYNAQPNERRVFTKTFELPSDEDVKDAFVVATADNVYALKINGVKTAVGNNFHVPDVAIVPEGALKPGKNIVSLEVLNEGSAPNPAGAIVCLRLNDSLQIVSDASWKNEDGSSVAELGACDMAPWKTDVDRTEVDSDATYPDWSVVQKKLRELKIAPEFESTGDVRWIRRIDGDLDLFYVGERRDEPQTTECVFRVANKAVELWDPMTGRRYRVDDAREESGRTIVPIRFEPSQSFFVVFRPKEEVASAQLQLPPSSEFLAPKRSETVVDLSEDWTVSFDQNAPTNRDFAEGAPKTVSFDLLTDWSKSADPYLRYYSGIGVYQKTFDLPSPLDPNERLALEFDDVQVMARVELNGRVLGTMWQRPWRIEIPSEVLAEKGNRLEISVANLWCNRLIGDASRPSEERFTRTSNPMWGPGDEQLLPSGLIGKARLVRRVSNPNGESD
ncbi:MAG: hypothetical protein IJM30_07475 [Thermoguttaceae bacterium]|nr:hypothetical protein [Thermoguttaceae bacterium]